MARPPGTPDGCPKKGGVFLLRVLAGIALVRLAVKAATKRGSGS